MKGKSRVAAITGVVICMAAISIVSIGVAPLIVGGVCGVIKLRQHIKGKKQNKEKKQKEARRERSVQEIDTNCAVYISQSGFYSNPKNPFVHSYTPAPTLCYDSTPNGPTYS